MMEREGEKEREREGEGEREREGGRLEGEEQVHVQCTILLYMCKCMLHTCALNMYTT